MSEIIKVRNAAYDRYGELLIKRDVLKKESYHYQMAYIREFGELMSELFEAKIRCIEKKKVIAFCQKKANRGETINQTELDQYIDDVMTDYYAQLHELLEARKSLEKSEGVSELTYHKIKKIYYRLAKLIHPDMNPALKDDETISDLWNRIVIAYQCNNLKELEELEVLVNGYLASIDYQHEEVEIPDLNEKICELNEEIENILKTDPYQYKYLLADEEAVAEKKEDLKQEIEDYRKYGEELDEIISSFHIERLTA